MFKVGQEVWCAMFGEGEVTKILTSNPHYPVEVSFGDSAPEYYTLGGKLHSYANQTLFPYPVEITKKVAKPSINWEHVDSKFNYLAEDANGDAFLYEKEPFITMTAFGSRGGEIAEVHMFASYVKGICDWKESLVKRPEGNSHDG
jgi:hypothetical protein